ncbi:aminoacyl-tRNA deacylase [Sneathiella glossodoripedis]|uniref:aminoacyl-tRNA deacylase n=1 Tax=Sneathiella glossodoripedis TaxID=418853 RepID=UPI0004727C82|nr:YbaK/EbsC family protein [Sneathiella glossodoripedis]
MGMATTLETYMLRAGVDYDMVHHDPSATISEAAHKAHIRSNCVAKAVVLKDKKGFVLAVVPSEKRISLEKINELTDRELALSSESEFTPVFDDCKMGAVPPIGNAYGVNVLMDQSLEDNSDIYFEAGDHENLVHVTDWDFEILMRGALTADISTKKR